MGLSYRGQLLGADEESLYLKTLMRYITLPMNQVSSIRGADEQEKLNKFNNIPKNFYQDPDLDPTPESGLNSLADSRQRKDKQKDLHARDLLPSGSTKDDT